jgi:hypothetical protein
MLVSNLSESMLSVLEGLLHDINDQASILDDRGVRVLVKACVVVNLIKSDPMEHNDAHEATHLGRTASVLGCGQLLEPTFKLCLSLTHLILADPLVRLINDVEFILHKISVPQFLLKITLGHAGVIEIVDELLF